MSVNVFSSHNQFFFFKFKDKNNNPNFFNNSGSNNYVTSSARIACPIWYWPVIVEHWSSFRCIFDGNALPSLLNHKLNNFYSFLAAKSCNFPLKLLALKQAQYFVIKQPGINSLERKIVEETIVYFMDKICMHVAKVAIKYMNSLKVNIARTRICSPMSTCPSIKW